MEINSHPFMLTVQHEMEHIFSILESFLKTRKESALYIFYFFGQITITSTENLYLNACSKNFK
jgi:hypothetical protein